MGSFGETLRQARLDKGVSFVEAEQETRIRHRYLQALENEDFSVLPAAVYTRGMIRSYARYLGLPEESMVDLFHSSRPREERVILRATSLHTPSRQRLPVGSLGLLLATIGVVGLLVLAWSQYASIAESLNAMDTRQDRRAETPSSPVARTPSAALSRADIPPLPTREPTPTPAPTATPTPIVGVLVEAKLVAATWMEVWVDGNKVLEEGVSAGAVRPFEGDRAVVMRVADGAAVEITENGSPRGILDRNGRAVEARWTRG